MANPKPTQQQQQEGPLGGTAVTQPGMRPPPLQPNMLNEEMAKQAAVKFKRKEKRIRKACATLDAGGDPHAQQQATCGCVIL